MASKELEKISSRTSKLEQKVLRRTQDPGEPTDYGPWEGAEDTQYRGVYSRETVYLTFAHIVNSFSPALAFLFTHILGACLSVQNLWSYFFTETLQSESDVLLQSRKQGSETLCLQDLVETQLNP